INLPLALFLIIFSAALLAYKLRKNWARYVLIGFGVVFVLGVLFAAWTRPAGGFLVDEVDISYLILVGYGGLCLAFLTSLLKSRDSMQRKRTIYNTQEVSVDESTETDVSQ
ncbi:MAG: hypothetical protein ABIK09_17500, partial [Pseudomonadota bacterium]